MPAPLSHQPPSPHPLLCLEFERPSRAGDTCGIGTGRTVQRGPLSLAQPTSGCTGLRVPVQRARWALWETPPGSPLEAAKQAVGKIPLGTSPKGKAVGQGQRGGRRQRAGSPALLRPSSTHAALALALVRLVSCLHTLSPSSQHLFPHPGQSTHRVTSRHVMPWHPGPPPSLCAGETTPARGSGDAVGADKAAPGACPAGDTRRLPRADGHGEGSRTLPVTY